MSTPPFQSHPLAHPVTITIPTSQHIPSHVTTHLAFISGRRVLLEAAPDLPGDDDRGLPGGHQVGHQVVVDAERVLQAELLVLLVAGELRDALVTQQQLAEPVQVHGRDLPLTGFVVLGAFRSA